MTRSGTILILCASPRRDGNSTVLAQSAAEGARAAGHEVILRYLEDSVTGFLRDCHQCRGIDGRCTIGDGFESLFCDDYLPSDGVILATPLHYYGMSARMKAFFDRTFCLTSESALDGPENAARQGGKRLGLLISCEETFIGATLGLVAQVQEMARYNRQDFVGVVVGIGNSRGEIVRDPADPCARAFELGRTLLDRRATDYCFDSDRDNTVWPIDSADID